MCSFSLQATAMDVIGVVLSVMMEVRKTLPKVSCSTGERAMAIGCYTVPEVKLSTSTLDESTSMKSLLNTCAESSRCWPMESNNRRCWSWFLVNPNSQPLACSGHGLCHD